MRNLEQLGISGCLEETYFDLPLPDEEEIDAECERQEEAYEYERQQQQETYECGSYAFNFSSYMEIIEHYFYFIFECI